MKNLKAKNLPALPTGQAGGRQGSKLKPMYSEIRKDYFLNQFVIITPSRAKRPRDIKEETFLNKDAKCQFCPENIPPKNIIDKIGKGKSWEIASLKNIFPAVTLNNPRAYGTQEVIIETPEHNIELSDLSENKILKLIEMYARRTREIAKNKKIDYILCFKNQGSKSGASIAHAHSQVFATAIIPPDIAEENYWTELYQKENHICPYCQIIKQELKSPRKIWADKNIIAFTPYASQFHYEAWIFPRRHLDNITLLNKPELKSFAHALKLILTKLKTLDLSFNYFLHNVISDNNQHLYLKIQPRDSIWAGVELGSGLVINSVPPEEAAQFYRK
ncbi:MAG: DUF4931 domain-containing protein [Patescibacteria group bacterium]|nr:DUF4931 domain-containing protein [Patescibacteria group bacterium]MDD4610687.1 DUF4931 domain-containing protein [Patescibacteria group bacterium]